MFFIQSEPQVVLRVCLLSGIASLLLQLILYPDRGPKLSMSLRGDGGEVSGLLSVIMKRGGLARQPSWILHLRGNGSDIAPLVLIDKEHCKGL